MTNLQYYANDSSSLVDAICEILGNGDWDAVERWLDEEHK